MSLPVSRSASPQGEYSSHQTSAPRTSAPEAPEAPAPSDLEMLPTMRAADDASMNSITASAAARDLADTSSTRNAAIPGAQNDSAAVSSATQKSVSKSADLVDQRQAKLDKQHETQSAERDAEQTEKPRLPTNLPVEFIDLYEVISLPRDKPVPDIRKRIAELYLDAQKNLDHRNAKKKLQYQQLFEVTLPQARHLLLDAERRVEYDRYLDEHRYDEGQRAIAEKVLSENSFATETSSVSEAAQKARIEEEKLTPEQLAARRADLWKKWEENLAHANDPLSKLQFSVPELKIRAIHRNQYMERALVEVHKADVRRAKEAAIRREKERLSAEEAEKQTAESQTETRYHRHYVEAVQSLASTARFCWGGGTGGFVIVLGLMALYYCNIAFVSQSTNAVIVALTFLVVGVLGSWRASSMGAESIRKLKKNHDMIQQEADFVAERIVSEKYSSNLGKKSESELQEIRAAKHTETLNQTRLLRRSSISAMVHLNKMAVWTFGAAIGGLILGFIGVFIFDTVLGNDFGGGRSGVIFVATLFAALFGVCSGFGGYMYARSLKVKQRDEQKLI